MERAWFVVAGVAIFITLIAVAVTVRLFRGVPITPVPRPPLPTDPHWEAVEALAPITGEVVGAQVRWSEPGKDGGYLYVGHYFVSPDNSLAWCLNGAESDAKRKNAEGKLPSEYRTWRPKIG